MVEKEYGDLLVRYLAYVHTAMNAIGGLIPVNLPRRELQAMCRSPVTILDREGIARKHHGHAMEGIAMPARGLAGRELQPSNDRGTASVDDLLDQNLIFRARMSRHITQSPRNE